MLCMSLTFVGNVPLDSQHTYAPAESTFAAGIYPPSVLPVVGLAQADKAIESASASIAVAFGTAQVHT